MLTAKELDSKVIKAVVDGIEKHAYRTQITVGGCVGGCVDITFNWDGDTPHVRKVWTVRYRLNGKQNATTFGTYDGNNHLTLAQFREKVNEFQKQVKAGIDVVAAKKENLLKKRTTATLAMVSREWLATKQSKLTERSYKQLLNRYNLHFGILQNMPITDITGEVVLNFLSPYNDKPATREKLIVIGNGLFEQAIFMGYTVANPFRSIGKHLPVRAPIEHYPTLTAPSDIAYLMKEIYAYKEIHPVLANLALFSIYTLARGQEARYATWSQIDLNNKRWVVPAELMKAGKEHIVPLSTGAMNALLEVKQLLPDSDIIFLSPRLKAFSDNAVRTMLRAIGYTNEQLTPHGFRAMGSTVLHELNYPHDWIEVSLAHTIGNAVSNSYNHAKLLELRANMLEVYYCYLTDLKDGKDIQQSNYLYRGF